MVRAKDLGPFPEMLYNVENKVKQFTNSLAMDPNFKDQTIPASVDEFLAGVSTFRELKRNNRLPANLTVIMPKPSSVPVTKKDSSSKKVCFPLLVTTLFKALYPFPRIRLLPSVLALSALDPSKFFPIPKTAVKMLIWRTLLNPCVVSLIFDISNAFVFVDQGG